MLNDETRRKLRILDQPPHLVVVFPLIDTVRQQLEAVIKGKGQRLQILLLNFEFLYEFADIQNAELSPGLIIQHQDHLPSDSNRCHEDIPWKNHRKRIRIPAVLCK